MQSATYCTNKTSEKRRWKRGVRRRKENLGDIVSDSAGKVANIEIERRGDDENVRRGGLEEVR